MGGVVSDAFNFRTAFTGAGFLMLTGFVCYFIYNKKTQREKAVDI